MSFDFESLRQYGWNDYFAAHFHEHARAGLQPGRVIIEYNQFLRVVAASGELLAETAGRLKHEATSREELPAVGDWVALRLSAEPGKAVIQAVLPRRSRFLRKTVGKKTEAQIVGANIDTIFLLTSLNSDFNPRRVERYLTSVWDSGARPVILLSKADLCDNAEDAATRVLEMQDAATGVPVHAISIVTHQGMDELAEYSQPGQTIALIGTSGVGKSSLINFLAGRSLQKVKEVREHDDRGQHTTQHRELFLLPNGGLILDTPGMRELQLWDGDEGVQVTFEDIEALAAQCAFSDCQHQTEPRCAVQAALQDGSLDPQRFENYQKLQRELRHLELRQDDFARRNEKKRWAKLSKEAEQRAKFKRR